MKNLFFIILLLFPVVSFAQQKTKDSVVYRITYRDTIVYKYKYDTIRIKHYVHSDTVWAAPKVAAVSIPPSEKKKHLINPNNWGIGPSVGAYYSPYNGFDVNNRVWCAVLSISHTQLPQSTLWTQAKEVASNH